MSKIRKSARGTDCQIRIAGVCSFDSAQTVACHIAIKGNSGMGTKPSDLFTVRACSSCHDIIDGRATHRFSQDQLARYKLEGLIRTQSQYLAEGLIKIA